MCGRRIQAQLGIEAISSTPEEVVTTMPWAASLCTLAGLLHGGALMAPTDMSLPALFLLIPAM
jgi:acyl-coenzyme A thioesterase PaaI-like protein